MVDVKTNERRMRQTNDRGSRQIIRDDGSQLRRAQIAYERLEIEITDDVIACVDGVPVRFVRFTLIVVKKTTKTQKMIVTWIDIIIVVGDVRSILIITDRHVVAILRVVGVIVVLLLSRTSVRHNCCTQQS